MSANSPKEWLKFQPALHPAAVLDDATLETTDVELDTKGFRFAILVFNIGVTDVPRTVQIQSATASGGTFADVTGASFSHTASDHDNAIQWGYIDMHSTSVTINRFLQLEGAGDSGTTALYAGTWILMNPRDTATDMTLGGAAGVSDEPDFEIN